jgi:hypothetical protein
MTRILEAQHPKSFTPFLPPRSRRKSGHRFPPLGAHNRTHATQQITRSLVGARKQCGRYIEAERLGGFEVDDQLELGGLLDRQVGRSVRAVGD